MSRYRYWNVDYRGRKTTRRQEYWDEFDDCPACGAEAKTACLHLSTIKAGYHPPMMLENPHPGRPRPRLLQREEGGYVARHAAP